MICDILENRSRVVHIKMAYGVQCHDETKNLLQRILLYIRSEKITIPFEKLIESIILGIPRPVCRLFLLQNKK